MDSEHGIPLGEVRQNDVLFCRGKSVQHHNGNVGYRKHVRERAHQYQSQESTAFDRDGIAREVLQRVHDSGGRFLCPDDHDGSWVECPHHIARIKVKQALRDLKIAGVSQKKAKLTSGRPRIGGKRESPRRGTEKEVIRNRSVEISSDYMSTKLHALLEVHVQGSNIHSGRGQCQTRSYLDYEAALDSGREEFYQGRRCIRSGRSTTSPNLPPDDPFYFSPPFAHSLQQTSSLLWGLQAYPSMAVSSLSYFSEKASLRISYMELLRGQGSSNSSSLDSETVDVLRKLRES